MGTFMCLKLSLFQELIKWMLHGFSERTKYLSHHAAIPVQIHNTKITYRDLNHIVTGTGRFSRLMTKKTQQLFPFFKIAFKYIVCYTLKTKTKQNNNNTQTNKQQKTHLVLELNRHKLQCLDWKKISIFQLQWNLKELKALFSILDHDF